MLGNCVFCGQSMLAEDAQTPEQANKFATMNCTCNEGMKFRNIEDMKEAAKANAAALFEVKDLPLDKEMDNAHLLDLMDMIIDTVAAGIINKCTLKLDERTTATIFITPKDGIKIKKNYKEEFVLEANHY